MPSTVETVLFNGKRLTARRGESVAACLTAAGVQGFRTTALGAERGMFCGMGVCQECLVEIDGKPNQRACMTKIDGPMTIRSEAHARPLPEPCATAGDRKAEPEARRTEEPEILIIGAGPGGLAAAIAARNTGAEVVVLDERSQPGGQYFKQPDIAGNGIPAPDAQHREGAALIARARDLGVVIRSGVTVWGGFAPLDFAASDANGAIRFRPKVAIVATGAYERGWPVPGWTLPGVMTTGAAQTLWRTARRSAGKRVLIAGNGPLNLQLAAELAEAGAKVVAVVEAAPCPGLSDFSALLTMATASPALVGRGALYHLKRMRVGTPIIYGKTVRRIDAGDSGLKVSIGEMNASQSAQVFEVDALCLGYGFEPANELLRGVGCHHDYDPRRRQLVTCRDETGLTTVPGLYALGDCTGLGGARAALAEGSLVGSFAARAIGKQPSASEIAQSQSLLARHRRFQTDLWELYRFEGYDPALADRDTLICRCEEVSFGQIEDALADDLRMIGAVKRQTRVGMGRCQGRYCAPVLDTLMSARLGHQRDEFSGFAPRVPVRPVRIEDIASL